MRYAKLVRQWETTLKDLKVNIFSNDKSEESYL